MQQLFCRKRTIDYNCTDFVIEAAKVLYQQDISLALQSLCGKTPQAEYQARRYFVKTNSTDKGIILFRNNPDAPHVGLLVANKVLHLGRKSVQYVDIDILMVEFTQYTCYRSRQ